MTTATSSEALAAGGAAGSTMRASVLHRAGTLRVEERPVPEPGPHQVLVRISSVGVCGSDVHYYDHGRIGRFVVEQPLVLGHEASGVVERVGAEVTGLRVGQRVSLEPGVPDLACEQCLAGRYNLCTDMRFHATPPVDGSFAELVVIHELFAHPVPEAISDDAAALLEPLSVALWACAKGSVTAGSRVLVTGAGPVGLLVVQVARTLGATEVAVSDISRSRLALARELGATAAIDVTTHSVSQAGMEPDVLIECSGNPEALVEALGLVAPAGRVVLVGMGSGDAVLPLSIIQERELVLTGTFRYAHTWPAAIALAATGQIDLEALVTGHYGLDEVEQALTAGRRDETTIKPIIRPAQR